MRTNDLILITSPTTYTSLQAKNTQHNLRDLTIATETILRVHNSRGGSSDSGSSTSASPPPDPENHAAAVILVRETFLEMSLLHLNTIRHELPLQNYNQKVPIKSKNKKKKRGQTTTGISNSRKLTACSHPSDGGQRSRLDDLFFCHQEGRQEIL